MLQATKTHQQVIDSQCPSAPVEDAVHRKVQGPTCIWLGDTDHQPCTVEGSARGQLANVARLQQDAGAPAVFQSLGAARQQHEPERVLGCAQHHLVAPAPTQLCCVVANALLVACGESTSHANLCRVLHTQLAHPGAPDRDVILSCRRSVAVVQCWGPEMHRLERTFGLVAGM